MYKKKKGRNTGPKSPLAKKTRIRSKKNQNREGGTSSLKREKRLKRGRATPEER